KRTFKTRSGTGSGRKRYLRKGLVVVHRQSERAPCATHLHATMFSMRRSTERAFTLVEILITVAIISILAMVIYGYLGGATAKGRDTKRHAEVSELALALRLYVEQYDAFPDYDSGIRLGEGGELDATLDPFMEVPHDPSGPDHDDLFYAYDSSYDCPL